ncbi:MAG: hypothetical protein IJ031_09135 [Oscillospiraceae bacterium]|nr:hypothetical protein [Oscillospiraceae bacterium]
MADEKKKPDVEEAPQDEKKSETSDQKPEEDKKEEPAKDEKSEDKAPDDKKADENGEGAPADKKSEEKQEDKPEENKAPETPQLSEVETLKAENLTLKTKLEALSIGFAPDCLDDAVTLAEAIVKRDGTDISAALQAVAKKYPDWKSDAKDGKSKGGFKVGADSSEMDKKADDDRLSAAFGIKKKK